MVSAHPPLGTTPVTVRSGHSGPLPDSPGSATLVLSPLADCARFSLRVPPEARAAAAEALGLDLPEMIGAITGEAERLALCLGPDEWYCLAPAAEEDAIVTRFDTLAQTLPLSLVVVSHRELGLALEGPEAALVLQSAIAFDVARMPVGTGCRTVFDKTQIILLRETPTRFRIEVWHSYAEHVWRFLRRVVREIELGI